MAARKKPDAPKDPLVELMSGDHRRALEAMRDTLARHLIAAESNVVAQVAGRLQAVLTELDALPVSSGMSRLDELRARREQRPA